MTCLLLACDAPQPGGLWHAPARTQPQETVPTVPWAESRAEPGSCSPVLQAHQETLLSTKNTWKVQYLKTDMNVNYHFTTLQNSRYCSRIKKCRLFCLEDWSSKRAQILSNMWCMTLHFGRHHIVELNLPSPVHTTLPDEPLYQVVLRRQENKTTY